MSCIKPVIHLVEFVNQKHAGPLAFESPHQRSGAEEVSALQICLQGLPVVLLPFRELHVEPLETFIEASNGLVFADAAIALQPFYIRSGRCSHRDRELGLPLTCGTFEEEGLPELRGQEDDLGHHGVDEIACRC
jgi:hypothetical protein